MEIDIERFEQEDITVEYLSWLSDKELMRYSSQGNLNHTVNTSLSYIDELRSGEGEFLKIILSRTKEMIGTLSLRRTSLEVIDLGIMIGAQNSKGRGAGTKAWGMGLIYAWENFPIERITAGAKYENKAMINIIQRSGMIFDKAYLDNCDLILKYSIDRPR